MNKNTGYFILSCVIIIFIGILLSMINVIGNFFIYIGFNTLFFIDNYFCLWKAFNPMVLWGFIFLIFGAIWGVYQATKKYNLKPSIRVFSLLGLFAFIALIGVISRPAGYGQSILIREDQIWKDSKLKNTYSSFSFYLREYPSGKHKDSANIMMDMALWKSTHNYQTYDDYTYYINLFPNGIYIDSAKLCQERALWLITKSKNNKQAYKNYLKLLPSGLHANEAKYALKKTKKPTKALQLVNDSANSSVDEKKLINVKNGN